MRPLLPKHDRRFEAQDASLYRLHQFFGISPVVISGPTLT